MSSIDCLIVAKAYRPHHELSVLSSMQENFMSLFLNIHLRILTHYRTYRFQLPIMVATSNVYIPTFTLLPLARRVVSIPLMEEFQVFLRIFVLFRGKIYVAKFQSQIRPVVHHANIRPLS